MLAAIAVTLALSSSALFESSAPLQLEIDAPLRDLVTHERTDNYAVTGVLTVASEGQPVRIDGVRISLRGHTSRAETECDFPKLKIVFPAGSRDKAAVFSGLSSIKIGTHCGEAADGTLTPKFGRLANEHSALREAFVYRLLAAVEMPTLLARRARITYRDSADVGGPVRQSLVRNALLIEDQDDAVRRVGGTQDIGEAHFTNARDQLTTADTVRLSLAEAMIGNFDWCLKMTPDDTYRCDARHPLWNIIAADRGSGRALPLIYDFDVAGIVTGRHLWFKNAFARAYAPSASEAEIEVIAQLQRARTLFTRRDLDQARAAFVARKPQAFEALAAAELDAEGATIAKRYLDSFYAQIESDGNFYRPVVRAPKTPAYTAADGGPVCGRRSEVPVGTPVGSPLQRSGGRVQVMLLDVLWHWTDPTSCDAVRRGPVWIDAAAIGTDFPERLPENPK